MSSVKDRSLGDTTAFRLGKAGQLVTLRFAARLEPLRLRPRHCGVLDVLRETPLHQFEVAHALGVTASVVVDMIDELESRGAVSRVRDPMNRRRQLVAMTAAGRRLHGRCVALAAQLDDELLGDLDEAQRKAFAETLRGLGPSGLRSDHG